MNTKTLLLLGGAYLLYQYLYRPPSPSMLPPIGAPVPGGGSIWSGIRWIDCSDPNADAVMCAQMQRSGVVINF